MSSFISSKTPFCCLLGLVWFGFGSTVVVVQSLSHVRLFVTPWTAARQASLSLTISQSLLKFMSIASVMPSNHLILWCPLLLPSIFPSIRDFSNDSAVHIRWKTLMLGKIGRTDAEAETPILWPPQAKSWLIGKDPDAGKDWGQEEKGTKEDEMAGWHHWFGGRESEWALGFGDGQGGLACCDSWGRKESDTTEQLNWTE